MNNTLSSLIHCLCYSVKVLTYGMVLKWEVVHCYNNYSNNYYYIIIIIIIMLVFLLVQSIVTQLGLFNCSAKYAPPANLRC